MLYHVVLKVNINLLYFKIKHFLRNHVLLHYCDTICLFYMYNSRKVAVVGAGYIAVELAGILNELGSDVSLFIRREQVSTTMN